MAATRAFSAGRPLLLEDEVDGGGGHVGRGDTPQEGTIAARAGVLRTGVLGQAVGFEPGQREDEEERRRCAPHLGLVPFSAGRSLAPFSLFLALPQTWAHDIPTRPRHVPLGSSPRTPSDAPRQPRPSHRARPRPATRRLKRRIGALRRPVRPPRGHLARRRVDPPPLCVSASPPQAHLSSPMIEHPPRRLTPRCLRPPSPQGTTSAT